MVSRNWYEVYVVNDKSDGWSPENEAIIYAALNACYSYAWLQAQGCRSYAVKCTDSEVNLLIQELGDSCYDYCEISLEDIKYYNKVSRLSGIYLIEKIKCLRNRQ